ncbi:GNAT family N-acetyltransferase [Roseibium marinum]|uniref:RimJ/RimL family protein N-acetyltransferase n=1 Tax=Roseibium marinum TaxID=281252 RepID=A0A2S3V2S4_9HYPH|nr:GNAT family N-acetyltransferase [Roseibium marinum]POF34236.1 RimJ/RimL family protein N-acetyltransferase [Roseibium marinum]
MSLPVLKTARLVLRPVAQGDADRIVELVGNFDVARMLSLVPHPYRREDALWWIDQTCAYADGGERAFAIDEGSGLIGAVSVGRDGPAPEFGYWLGKPYWGRGLMTEAGRAALAWYFEAFRDASILSGALDENSASLNVLRKLGFAGPHPHRLRIKSRGQDLPGTRVRLTFETFNSAARVLS